MSPRALPILLLLLSAGPAQGLAASAPLAEKARAVLQQHCLSCHGEARISGLDLRQRESLLKGGDSGPAIVPGHPEESLLYLAVLQTGKLKMPVGGALSPEEVEILREWIQAGAPWEQDPHGSDGLSTWWSFQGLGDPKAPGVRNAGWVRTPVDAFVLHKLEEKGLDPAPRAGKLTLLRRAKFDLHGLPPTEREIERFLGDTAPGAFARLVDRLLASPRYGERWGRHWLDIARYADSSGLDEDITMPYAWRYRDYVIDSFNRDLPYDRFVKDQIAGDLYPSSQPGHPNVRALLGTGFLAVGPRAIAQQDKMKMLYDLVDEQIDTLSKSFLGLTIACARCHDHKFDPISTRDYYSLASIFASTRSFSVLKPADMKPPFVSKFYFEPLVPKEVHQRYQRHQDRIKGREALIEAVVLTGVAEHHEEKLYPLLAEYMLAARRVYRQGEPLKEIADEADLDPQLLQRWIDYLRPGNAFRPYLEKWHRAEAAGLARMAGEYQDLFNRLAGEWHQRLRQWKQQVDRAVREGKAPPKKAAFEDGFITVEGRFFNSVTSPPPKAEGTKADSGPFGIQEEDREKLLPKETRDRLAALREEVERLEQSSPPEPPLASAVAEGKPVDQKVFVRGSYQTPGESVPKQFPVVLAGSRQTPVTQGSGRRELAEWLTQPDHPLTSRVMVNRIWQWHFGEGLVRTPNNFGTTGEKPTHPRLLDYLARRFVKSGWSVKAMHRLLLLSNTYQQSSQASPGTRESDLDNRLWSRGRRRRLTVEEMRDAFLALDGSLDLAMGGTLASRKMDYAQKGPEQAFHPNETRRRSLYVPVIRNKIPSVMKLFDFANSSSSSARRTESNVATQALYMMNSENVDERSRSLAGHLMAADDREDSRRVRRAYLITLTRQPTPQEVEESLLYLQNYPAGSGKDPDSRLEAWQSLCRILMTSNEFNFVN